MDIAELIWIFIIMYVLYRLLFAPAKPRQQQRYDVPSEPSYEEEDTATKSRDDILDEMRTIFGEESTTRKPQRKPTHSPQQPAERGQTVDSHGSKYASYTGADFIDTRDHRSEADKALKDVSLKSPSLRDQKSPKKHSFHYLFEHSEIRKGIIISEILGKPKSRKRRNV